MVAIQRIPYSKNTQPDLTELYGNIYVDQKSTNLRASMESEYDEMDPKLLEYWRCLRGKLMASR
jgi:hypothetical protein